MANVSVPKVLFGVIYFLIPILCWFVTPVHDLFPEEWMIAAVVAVVFLLGFFFLLRKSNLVFEILAIVCLIASLVLTGYMAYPSIQKDFAQVDIDYENESGDYYSADDTVFQEKQQVLAFDAINQIPNAINYAWGAMGILLVVFGLYSCKEIISYAMIPANKSTKFNPNEEIPENVEASTNRPTAEQRAQALAQMHATGSAHTEDGPKPYEPKQNDAEPDWNLNIGGAPVIKTPTEVNQGSSSTIATDPNKKSAEPAVTYDGRVNINLDLGEDFVPKVTVEKENEYADANQMPGHQDANPGATAHTEPKQQKVTREDIIDMEEQAAGQEANPFASMGNMFDSTPKKAHAVVEPAEQPAANPFASMGNLFDDSSKAAAAPAPAPAPQPAKAAEQPTANPFATMGNLFDNAPKAAAAPTAAPAQESVKVAETFKVTPAPAPAQTFASAPAPKVVLTPAPEPVKAAEPAAPKVVLTPEPEPVKAAEPVTSKVVLTPEPEPAAVVTPKTEPPKPVAPVTNVSSEPMTEGVTFRMPEGPKEAPKPAVPKSKMDPAEKARIRELNAQVAELKTLYNQGMITQEEYVAQRTELLQQMYNHS